MQLKRFVTYIYAYENGIRGKNTGFIKTDFRDSCQIDIQLRNLTNFIGKGIIYLIVRQDQQCIGIPASDISISHACGHIRLALPQNLIGESQYLADQIQAVVIRYSDQLLVSNWTDNVSSELLHGEFAIWEKKPAPQDDNSNIINSSQTDCSGTANSSQANPSDSANTSSQTAKANTEAPSVATGSSDTIDDSGTTFRKIAIADIRALPKRNWYLCNNSFVIHGFFNYHYLLLKTVTDTNQRTRQFLGVPGIYEQPEQMMALLFGFPNFEPALGSENVPEGTSAPTFSTGRPEDVSAGVFGFWMCELLE